MEKKQIYLNAPENLEHMSEKEIKKHVKQNIGALLDTHGEKWNEKAVKKAPFLCIGGLWGVIFGVCVYVKYGNLLDKYGFLVSSVPRGIGIIIGLVSFLCMLTGLARGWFYDVLLNDNIDNLLKEKERRINAKQYNNRR